MTDLPFVERIRTIMQNHHVGLDYEFGTPEQRAAHREQEEAGYRAMLAKLKAKEDL